MFFRWLFACFSSADRSKCDESKPSCSACLKRGNECLYPYSYRFKDSSFEIHKPEPRPLAPSSDNVNALFVVGKAPHELWASTSRSSTLTPSASCVSDHEAALQFSLLDLELMHHWSTVLCLEMDEYCDTDLWQHQLPKLGLRYKPVTHLLLAMSARHLSRTDKTQDLLHRAEHHYGLAVAEFVGVLSDIEGQHRETLVRAASLFGFYYLACGPVPGQYVAFTDGSEDSEFYKLLCGVRDILKLLPQPPAFPKEDDIDLFRYRFRPGEGPSREFRASFQRLPEVLELCGPQDPPIDIYQDSIRRLERRFTARFTDEPCETWERPIFGWLFIQTDDFMAALRAKRPAALIIFAYSLVLLADNTAIWYCRDWPQHALAGICRYLPVEHQRGWLDWPSSIILSS